MRFPSSTLSLALCLSLPLSLPPLVAQTKTANGPELGPIKKTETGVAYHEVTTKSSGRETRLWVYLPDKVKKRGTPCVIIAPAGTRMCHGLGLAKGDQAEHTPWTAAGYVVVAYDIAGEWPKDDSEAKIKKAIKEFMKADAGVANGKAAVSFALRLPQVDRRRVFTAGHSSAATLALQLTAADSRVRGCAAFAPVTDLAKQFGGEGGNWLEETVKGSSSFFAKRSPSVLIKKLRVPIYLFVAEDDAVVAAKSLVAFAGTLGKRNKRVTLERVKRGGHYDPMIKVGIPGAIKWISQGMKPAPAKK